MLTLESGIPKELVPDTRILLTPKQQEANRTAVLQSCKRRVAAFASHELIVAWRTGCVIANWIQQDEAVAGNPVESRAFSLSRRRARTIASIARATKLTIHKATLALDFFTVVSRATVYGMCRTNRRYAEVIFDFGGISRALKLRDRSATLQAIERTFKEPRKLKNIAAEMLRAENE